MAFLALFFGLTFANIAPKVTADYKKLDLAQFYVSEKLDGIRAFWDGHALYSRSGNKFEAPSYFIENFPDFALDGELYARDLRFEDITSIVKSSNGNWRALSYNIFDVPKNTKNANNSDDLKIRLNALKPYLEKSTFLKIIPQLNFDSQNELQKYIKNIKENGGEGVIFRQKNSDVSFKYKFYQDSECVVLEILKGSGKYANKMGSLLCQEVRKKDKILNDKETKALLNELKVSPNDLKEVKNGYFALPIIFKIGSGFSDFMRDNPPEVGSILTYKYYNLTKRQIPRHPIFLRIREID